MRVFDLLKLMESTIAPEETKVHLATWNGEDNPLDVYLAGDFPEWQRWQTKRNFEKRFVISLIALPAPNKWLFAGAYGAAGCEEKQSNYYYQLNEISSCAQMNGRLIAHFERPGRQSYLKGDRWAERIVLSEILAERLRIADFPGYRAIDLSKEELDIIQAKPSIVGKLPFPVSQASTSSPIPNLGGSTLAALRAKGAFGNVGWLTRQRGTAVTSSLSNS